MIDLRAAYDSIDRSMIKIRTKAPKPIKTLKTLCIGNVAAIKHTSEQFRLPTGCFS